MKNNEKRRTPRYSSRGCTACWACAEACPQRAIRKISFLWHRHVGVRRGACVGCMKCVRVCPNGCFSER